MGGRASGEREAAMLGAKVLSAHVNTQARRQDFPTPSAGVGYLKIYGLSEDAFRPIRMNLDSRETGRLFEQLNSVWLTIGRLMLQLALGRGGQTMVVVSWDFGMIISTKLSNRENNRNS